MLEICQQMPELETERLLLRKLQPEDAADTFDFLSDPKVTQFTPYETVNSHDAATQFVRTICDDCARGEKLIWGVELKADQKVSGLAGFAEWPVPGVTGEIVYLLSQSYWRQGYALEAAEELLRFGFHVMPFHRIQAVCKTENIASRRVLEKMGMTFEGVLREFRFQKGEFQSYGMYSMLRHEWLARVSSQERLDKSAV